MIFSKLNSIIFKNKTCFLSLLLVVLQETTSNAQIFNKDTVTFGPFDNGKMWTFDNPPIDYFEKRYGFKPTQEWLDDVQMSALRFATYCSASFVSADGLVMTNHHCARESGTSVGTMNDDFNNNGFYAKKLADERKVPGLFVDQLVKRLDITKEVFEAVSKIKNEEKQDKAKDSFLLTIIENYKKNPEWQGLTLQTVTYYKGGKYSLYGFKRHNDVRLVFMPELQLGFYGGDPDNFTYPRYALDFSFFRVYGEDGKPLKTTHFFKFNINGIKNNEPVFVVGNPGNTNRLSTTSQIDYYRDVYFPAMTKLYRSRADILTHYNETFKNDSLLNEIFILENAHKALTGQYGGLLDKYIYTRKKVFNDEFKSKIINSAETKDQAYVWDSITVCRTKMRKYYPEVFVFTQRDFNSPAFNYSLKIMEYAYYMKKDTAKASKLKKYLLSNIPKFVSILDIPLLKQQLTEAKSMLGTSNGFVKRIISTNSIDMIAESAISGTAIYDEAFIKDLLSKSDEQITINGDPLLKIARWGYTFYKPAFDNLEILNKKERTFTSKLAQLLFKVYGETMPPDANFSLRIADGVVKGYSYNGTEAPFQTTYYGLYDRYLSHDKKYPWSLPTRWENPTEELLKTPMNFVSTNDIIGGNSGSPMINKYKEVVGLIFDGNMESLPGRFIFLEEKNRTVSVHAGGMVAALKYVYKAKRLYKELTAE